MSATRRIGSATFACSWGKITSHQAQWRQVWCGGGACAMHVDGQTQRVSLLFSDLGALELEPTTHRSILVGHGASWTTIISEASLRSYRYQIWVARVLFCSVKHTVMVSVE